MLRGVLHGLCDRSTGACQCFRSATQGFWKGKSCGECYDDYFGENCMQKRIVSTQITGFFYNASATARTFTERQVLLDDEYGIVYAVGDIITAFDYRSTSEDGYSLVFAQTARTLFGCGFVSVTWTFDSEVFFALPPFNGKLCRTEMEFWRFSRLADNPRRVPTKDGSLRLKVSGSHVSSIYVAAWDSMCEVSVDIASSHYFECLNLRSKAKASSATLLSFFKVEGVEYLLSENAVIVYGFTVESGKGVLCEARLIYQDMTYRDVFRSSATEAPIVLNNGTIRCNNIQLVRDLPQLGAALVAMDSSVGPAFFVMNSSRRYLVPDVVLSTLTSKYQTTAASVDIDNVLLSQCVLVVSDARCHLVKLRVGVAPLKVELYGLNSIERKEAIVDIRNSNSSHVAFLLFSGIEGSYVRRILLWDVVSVFPPVSYTGGGTLLTVRGSGFRSTKNVSCFVASSREKRDDPLYKSRAVVIDSNTLVCSAPPAALESSCGMLDYVEVSLTGSSYTSNAISISRIGHPRLTQVAPTAIFVPRPPPKVTIAGVQFVESAAAKCRFNGSLQAPCGSPTATVTSWVTEASTIKTTLLVCTVPPFASGLCSGSTLEVALDGSVFTTEYLTFQAIGEVAGIQFTSSVYSVACQAQTFVPFEVVLVDRLLNTVGSFDATAYSLTLVPSQATSAAYQTARLLHGQLNVTMANGRALFRSVFLLKPLITAYTPATPDLVYSAVIQGYNWSTSASVHVVVGNAYRLVLLVEPSANVSSSGELGESPRVCVVDVGGNMLSGETDETTGLTVLSSVLTYPPASSVQLSAPPAIIPILNRNVTMQRGAADFTPMKLAARHYFIYQVMLSTPERPDILSVWSRNITSVCSEYMYKVAGLYLCSSCPLKRRVRRDESRRQPWVLARWCSLLQRLQVSGCIHMSWRRRRSMR